MEKMGTKKDHPIGAAFWYTIIRFELTESPDASVAHLHITILSVV
jgi:hypothetical protein